MTGAQNLAEGFFKMLTSLSVAIKSILHCQWREGVPMPRWELQRAPGGVTGVHSPLFFLFRFFPVVVIS